MTASPGDQVMKNGTGLVTNTYDGSGMRTKKVALTARPPTTSIAGPTRSWSTPRMTGSIPTISTPGASRSPRSPVTSRPSTTATTWVQTRATTDQNGKISGLCKYDAWGKLESTNEYDEGVINGEFELATIAGQVLNWVPGDSDCAYVANDGQNGSHALKISRTAGSSYWVLPNVFASPDTDYELSGYFYSGNEASVSAKAQLVYYDMNGSVLGTDETELLGYSSGWKQFTLTSHSPATAAYMEIRLTQGSDGWDGGLLRWGQTEDSGVGREV